MKEKRNISEHLKNAKNRKNEEKHGSNKIYKNRSNEEKAKNASKDKAENYKTRPQIVTSRVFLNTKLAGESIAQKEVEKKRKTSKPNLNIAQNEAEKKRIEGKPRSTPWGRNNNNTTNNYTTTLSEDYYNMAAQLKDSGHYQKEIASDGNCLFRALSDQLEGTDANHIKHRAETAKYMAKYRSEFDAFVDSSITYDSYIQKLGTPCTHAGDDAILAFARHHNVAVNIHQLNRNNIIINESCNFETLQIAYHAAHYSSVYKTEQRNNPNKHNFLGQRLNRPPHRVRIY